jgi:hypothetical protein
MIGIIKITFQTMNNKNIAIIAGTVVIIAIVASFTLISIFGHSISVNINDSFKINKLNQMQIERAAQSPDKPLEEETIQRRGS